MSEPGWSPQFLPGGSGDSEQPRIQSSGFNQDTVLIATMAGAAAVVGAVVLGLFFPDQFPLPVMGRGAILGTATGLMAIGLVLTYRTTRIINFSYGAMGGFAASIPIGLNQGSMGLSWVLAVPLGVVIGAVMGAVIERVVIRRFIKAPRLVLTVATIGLAQLLGGAALFVPSWFDLASVLPGFDTFLSDRTFATSHVVFNGNDLALLLVVPIVLGGLGWFLRMTEAGIAVRGMAENMDRARLLGIPVNQLSLLLWAIAGALAALTVLLRAPGSGIPFDAAAGPTLLLPALAAAVVSRMRSMTIAFLTGVGLGVVEQLILWNYEDQRELTYPVFFGLIVVALLLQRRGTSRAEQAEELSWTTVGVSTKLPRHLARLPEVVAVKLLLGVLVAGVMIYIPLQGSGAQIVAATNALIFALVALSLVILTGWGGVVSLGQFALAGVGGLVAANLIATRNTDLFLMLGAAAVAGGVVAFLIGLPALRVVGQYLAVTTLAFAVMTEHYIIKPAIHEDLIPGDFRRPELWGRLTLDDPEWMYALCLGFVVLTAVIMTNLRNARAGRSITAARDNERSAAAVGISSVETRLAAFVFAGMLAGIAGALYAVSQQNVGEQTYRAADSLLLFSMAVIGGIGSLGGTLAGVALVEWLGYWQPDYKILLTGVGLLLILMVVPGGLGQALEQLRDRFATWCARRRGMELLHEPDDVDRPPSGRGSGAPPGGPPASRPQSPGSPAYGAPAQTQAGYVPSPYAGGAYRSRRGQDRVSLLSCNGVETSYGSFQVLFGIDTTVGRGEMLALLGTNGAGKSTLLKSMSGLLPPGKGKIIFDGTDITNLPAERIARLGLSLMPGGRGVFPRLSVAENLRLAGWMLRHDRRRAGRARSEVLKLFPVLRERWDQLAGDLSGGEQQQLSLAMALMSRPKLLCIDELSLGLAPSIVGQLVDKVREVHASGTAIVVVEQSVNVALLLCERAVFLEKGQVRFRGPTTGLLERPDVLRAVFLGDVGEAPPAAIVPPAQRPSRGVELQCQGLVKRFGGIRAVSGVDLHIPPATILGLIGHNGAGKTTLFDVLTGFLPADAGRVYLGGRDVTKMPPHRRAIVQLGRSFQEARLYPSLTVAETLAVALETHLTNRDPLAAALRLPASRHAERTARERVDMLVEMLSLQAYRDRPTGELSTGTRRIVELGCLLAQDPAVVLLDEPSGGVAQREAEALPPLLRRVQVETGCSLVVIEHDMTLLSALCDALVALEQGAVIASGTPAKVLSDERVIASYLGTEQQVVHRSGMGTGPSMHTPPPGFHATAPWRGQSPNPQRPTWP